MPLNDNDYEVIKQLFSDVHNNYAKENKEILERVEQKLQEVEEREQAIAWIKGWLLMFRFKWKNTEFEISMAGVITVTVLLAITNYL